MDSSFSTPTVAQPSPKPPSPAGPRASLPVTLTPLIGREREVEVALALLQRPGVRLLTCIGPGGIGKTRLSIQIARAAAALFPDGVRFVALAAVSDPDLVVPTIARALDIAESGTVAIEESLALGLGDASMLLILDNFEHLLTAAPLLTQLLFSCPNLTLLVTSRSLLRVTGEHAVPVPPLGLAAAGDTETAGPTWPDAVRLFTARAQAVNPAFALTDESAPVVVEICRQLDGVPLAIELAAARTNHLPLPALRERLERRLPLLTGGPRNAPHRLRSMHDAIAWSHDLLDHDTRLLIQRLAVFADGFTLEAAEYVGGQGGRGTGEQDGSVLSPQSSGLSLSPCPPVPLPSVLDGIARLVEASLLQRERGPDGSTRFRMLETVREFAGEQLVSSGDEAIVRQRHAAFYLDLAERFPTTPFLPDSPCEIDRRDAEHGNLRAALTWLADGGHHDDYVQLAGALGWFWLFRGHRSEVRTILERARHVHDASARPGQARVELAYAMVSMARGELVAAGEAAAESRTLALAANDSLAAAQAIIIQGAVHLVGGDYDSASARLEEARRLGQTLPDPRQARAITSSALSNLGVVAHSQGQIDLAKTYHEEGLAGHRAVGDCWDELHALIDLADVALGQGDLDRAAAFYREGLALGWRSGQRRAVFEALDGLACTVAAMGQATRAARWFATVARARQSTGLTFRDPVDTAAFATAVDTVRTQLGDQAFDDAWAAGRELPLDNVVAEALNPSSGEDTRQRIGLTPRELEILHLLVAGQSNREIADALFVSVRTVEDHVAHILTKLGARTRSVAVSAAIAAGLVTQ